MSIPPRDAAHQHGQVVYEIHYHPTYSAPCLWFNLHGLPDGENPLSIDTVFSRLVPSQYWPGLQGGIGGISMDVRSPVDRSASLFPFFLVYFCFVISGAAKYEWLTGALPIMVARTNTNHCCSITPSQANHRFSSIRAISPTPWTAFMTSQNKTTWSGGSA